MYVPLLAGDAKRMQPSVALAYFHICLQAVILQLIAFVCLPVQHVNMPVTKDCRAPDDHLGNQEIQLSDVFYLEWCVTLSNTRWNTPRYDCDGAKSRICSSCNVY